MAGHRAFREGPVVWPRSSYSSLEGNCVEVADLPGGVAVRDSKDPAGSMLTVSPRQWATFIGAATGAVAAGE